MTFRKKNENMNISKKVYTARQTKGLTQEALAEKAGLSLSTIKRIEKGKVTPRAHTLMTLSDVLEINLLPDTIESLEPEDNLLLIATSIILLFLPPLHLLYLFALKSSKKKKFTPESTARKLLVFQISSLSFFILFLFAVLNMTQFITGQKIYGQINSPLILYTMFVIMNMIHALSLTKSRGLANDTKMTPI